MRESVDAPCYWLDVREAVCHAIDALEAKGYDTERDQPCDEDLLEAAEIGIKKAGIKTITPERLSLYLLEELENIRIA